MFSVLARVVGKRKRNEKGLEYSIVSLTKIKAIKLMERKEK